MARHQKKNQAVSFSSNVELDITNLNQILSACKKAHTKHIRFGWINGRKYADKKNKGLYVATVARWNEFGTSSNGLPLFNGGNGGMVARPSLSQTFYFVEGGLKPLIEKHFKDICRGVYSKTNLEVMNRHIEKSFSDVVVNQNFASLSDITIKLKGHSFILEGTTGKLLSNFESKTFSTNHNNMRDGAK